MFRFWSSFSIHVGGRVICTVIKGTFLCLLHAFYMCRSLFIAHTSSYHVPCRMPCIMYGLITKVKTLGILRAQLYRLDRDVYCDRRGSTALSVLIDTGKNLRFFWYINRDFFLWQFFYFQDEKYSSKRRIFFVIITSGGEGEMKKRPDFQMGSLIGSFS